MKKYALLILLAIIMLALPWHLRLIQHNTFIAGDETYHSVNIAKQIAANGFSFGGILDHSIQPYQIILAESYKIFGQSAFKIIPLIFALLSFILFIILIQKFTFQKNTKLWMLSIFALSPTFISLGFYNLPYAFELSLILLSLIILQTRYSLFSAPLILLASVNSVSASIASIFALAFFAIIEKQKRKTAIILSFIPLMFLILLPYNFSQTYNILSYFSDLGGTFGFGAFQLMLMLICAILLWPKKQYTMFFAVSFYLLLAILVPTLLPFTLPVISILCGYSLAFLFTRKWELTSLRTLTLFVIFLGILFSAISHATTIAKDTPSADFMTTLNKLNEGTILTAEYYGPWVNFTGHKSLLDKYQTKISQEQKDDLNKMFFGTELETTKDLLDKYNVDYAIITPEMKKGLVWSEDNFGLAFLVNNNETFKRIPTENTIEIYQIK